MSTALKITPPQLDCGGRVLDLSSPRVMGILNVTPDSFSDGGSLYTAGCPDRDKALSLAQKMIAGGASIIDVGGESTRPGAAPVSLQEELDRVLPIIEAISESLEVVISVDSSRPEIMRAAAGAGAGLLNDVRALGEEGAIAAARDTGLPVCLMHMQGQPGSMQSAPHYHNVVGEVVGWLENRAQHCIEQGIPAERILLDPGFGFGKNPSHNLMLLNRLPQLVALGYPVLVGLSRKSLIDKVLGRPLDRRLAGSLALATMAVLKGASIIRVHDVVETSDAIKLCEAVQKESLV
jgi:dihydropteroate synthase